MAEGKLRVDRWLWFARVVKTRTLAQKLIKSGKIRVNREKITHVSYAVSIGDVLTISLPNQILIYEIAALGGRRGPYQEAQTLYKDLSPEPPKDTERDVQPKVGRPDKRQRRLLKEIKSQGNFGQ